MPPTTPPAMAPTFEPLFEVDEVEFDGKVSEGWLNCDDVTVAPPLLDTETVTVALPWVPDAEVVVPEELSIAPGAASGESPTE